MAEHEKPQSQGPQRVALLSLLVAVASACLLLFALWGWYREAQKDPLAELTDDQRRALVEDIVQQSPGIYRWAYFEPRIGFTLRPNAEIRAYDDIFTSNELGYRTAAVTKEEGVYRIVFIGDSWTYGMGIQQSETFGEQLALLANQHAGLDQRVEAWVLALSGYNTFNEIAALWYYFDRLQPDAVVLTVSGNDNHSTLSVLPNGSTTTDSLGPDQFGAPHTLAFHGRYYDSYRYRKRWRQAFDAIGQTKKHLEELDTPLLLFFLARWEPPHAHAMIQRSNLELPYIISPTELTRGQWGSGRFGHGSPAANELYARMVYRGLANLLGWAALPPGDERADVGVFSRAPDDEDWLDLYDRESVAITRRFIKRKFEPPIRDRLTVIGPLRRGTGLMGRATTVMVRRLPRATALEITVRRIEGAPTLYPLELTAAIPSPSGGTRSVTIVPAGGRDRHTFTIDIPQDLGGRTALDVDLFAARTAARQQVADEGASVYIELIENRR